jgi:hypothetical protein
MQLGMRPVAEGILNTVNDLMSIWDGYKISMKLPEKYSGMFIGLPSYITDGMTINTNHTPVSGLPGGFKASAQGSIAYKPTLSLMAEIGVPEAAIPLNQGGADVLAATMRRYIDPKDVIGGQSHQYASPVINNNDTTYDHRTQFTGPITVQAQDPDEMAHKLAAKRRRQRLSQPIGGRA